MCTENKLYRSPYGKSQHGFVLVMSLVLLAVLTLVGVSSMNSANLELRAASNAQQHQIAFNAVQSVIEFTVSAAEIDTKINYQTSDPTITQTATYSNVEMKNVSALSATVDYADCSLGDGGSSLEEGKGFSFNHFGIVGNGANKAGTATSTQAQGIRFPVAACN